MAGTMERNQKKKIVIITGASSGLGEEFALQLDQRLHTVDEIWLIARRRERLTELAQRLCIPVRVFPMDLTDPKEIDTFSHILRTTDPSVCMLINCAGYGLMGAFACLDMEEQAGMLRLNCEALMRMTYLCIPYMPANARLIQLASSAAFLPQKNFAVYAATKSFVLSFSMALQEELRKRRIWVTAVCPGPVDTEFFDIAEKYGTTLAVKKLILVSAQRVVAQALEDCRKKRPVSICSMPIRSFRLLCKMLPHTMILKLVSYMK